MLVSLHVAVIEKLLEVTIKFDNAYDSSKLITEILQRCRVIIGIYHPCIVNDEMALQHGTPKRQGSYSLHNLISI